MGETWSFYSFVVKFLFPTKLRKSKNCGLYPFLIRYGAHSMRKFQLPPFFHYLYQKLLFLGLPIKSFTKKLLKLKNIFKNLIFLPSDQKLKFFKEFLRSKNQKKILLCPKKKNELFPITQLQNFASFDATTRHLVLARSKPCSYSTHQLHLIAKTMQLLNMRVL